MRIAIPIFSLRIWPLFGGPLALSGAPGQAWWGVLARCQALLWAPQAHSVGALAITTPIYDSNSYTDNRSDAHTDVHVSITTSTANLASTPTSILYSTTNYAKIATALEAKVYTRSLYHSNANTGNRSSADSHLLVAFGGLRGGWCSGYCGGSWSRWGSWISWFWDPVVYHRSGNMYNN